MDVENQVAPEKPQPLRLRRREAAEWVFNKYGFRLSEKTLRNHHTLGTGPRCEYFGSWWFTRPEWMTEWVEGRLRATPANRREAA